VAIDYIAVTRTKQLGNTLVRAADLLREFRELIDKVKDTGNHMHDGSNYTAVETNFGLAAGTGSNVMTLIGLIDEIFNTNTTVAGQTRLDRIDEFVSRLAGQ
jgi:hypothetical protein